jgi:hypothetical protein
MQPPGIRQAFLYAGNWSLSQLSVRPPIPHKHCGYIICLHHVNVKLQLSSPELPKAIMPIERLIAGALVETVGTSMDV